jgi:hypothetical protein
MATYTDALGFNKGSAGFHAAGLTKVNRVEVELDFAAIAAARSAAGATALAAGDVLEAIPLPAKALVMAVGVDVTTAGTTDLDLDIGDGTDPDGFHDGISVDAVGSFCTALALAEAAPNTVVGYSNGKYYSAADTIDVKLVGAVPGNLVCRVWALVVDAA